MIKDASCKFDDYSISPKIRQILLHWGYANADMKICQYLQLYIKNTMPNISHFNTSYVLRYAHSRYVKCLFANIQTMEHVKD